MKKPMKWEGSKADIKADKAAQSALSKQAKKAAPAGKKGRGK